MASQCEWGRPGDTFKELAAWASKCGFSLPFLSAPTREPQNAEECVFWRMPPGLDTILGARSSKRLTFLWGGVCLREPNKKLR